MLRQSELRYRRFFESAKDGALILDAQTGTIQDVNPFLLSLLGYQSAELLGKRLWDIGLLRDALASQTAFHDLQKREYIRYEDLPLVSKAGTLIEVEFIGSAYWVGQTKVIQCVVRDIRERKAAERRLQELTARLERSNRELESFAYVASHDLQEPLRKIQAFGDRLKARCHDDLSPEGQDYVERMQSAASRMQSLINDLLAFSRIATKGQPFVPVDLNVIVREVQADMEARVQETRAQVDVGALPVVEADPLQMRQLFQNLLSNALKFRRPDVSPQVQIIVEGVADGGRVISITDNGIGFEEKHQERIFGLFQRLHGRSAYPGTGIGLAICRRILERHGGIITARSANGQGTTFTIVLPLRHDEHKAHDEDRETRVDSAIPGER